jgi:hypothetical protein
MSRGIIIAMTLCAGACTVEVAPGDDTEEPPPTVEREVFRECRGRAFEPAPAQAWRHDFLTPIVTAAGAANHMGRDLIASTSQGSRLAAKFTYGAISKDLQDEDVRVFVDDCTGWVELGDFATDSDGQIAVDVPMPLGTGVYDVMFQVLGDRSLTSASLWVLPRGTHITVTDIDGTLTVTDRELFQQIFDGSHVPGSRPEAVELTHAHAERGHIVMYLTGRPDWLTNKSRDWLRDLGFAPGPLRVTDSNTQILPVEGSVGDFKKTVLADLIAAGYLLDFAYGNAATDIYAYLGAGLPPATVWIVGDHAGERATNPVEDSWAARVTEVEALALVEQPYDR